MQLKQRCLNPKESGTMLTSEFKARKKNYTPTHSFCLQLMQEVELLNFYFQSSFLSLSRHPLPAW